MKRRTVLVLSIAAVGVLLTGCGRNASEKGVKYLEEGKYKEAVEQFEKAIDREVNTGDAYRGIGIAKWEQKDYEGALEAFQAALGHGAKKTGILYNFMGSCAMNLENPSEALNYYRMGLGQEGNSKELEQEMRFNMIAAYEQVGDWEGAKVKLREYVEDYPDDEEAQKELEFLETR